jgi:hypothetical protein
LSAESAAGKLSGRRGTQPTAQAIQSLEKDCFVEIRIVRHNVVYPNFR